MKTHTKANGYYKDLCHYSRTGWAWWKKPVQGDVCQSGYCTCVSCKPPKTERANPPDSGRYLEAAKVRAALGGE